MKMLICSDGSEQADRALGLGTTIAAGCKAEVTVLGIVERPAEAETVNGSLHRGLAMLQERNVKAELITRTGKAIDEIVRRTKEVPYGLVLIGAVRKRRQGAFWMSAKAYKIIKEVMPPVMIAMGAGVKLKRILVCSGGKPYIENAVQLTGELARGVGAEVCILHVLPEPPALYAHLSRIHEDAEALLQSNSELGANLRHARELLQGMNVAGTVRLRCGSVIEEIVAEMREQSYDLAVTGSAIHPTLSTYVLGDVTREIVNHANCAVLIVRSHTGPRQSNFSLRSLLGRTSS
jgi:nucleotide-binding universal stress UspA family protein